jgi:uncharacterized repeat protein (TIGR01451 family)
VAQTDASGDVPFTFPAPTLVHNSVSVSDVFGGNLATSLGTVAATTTFADYPNTASAPADPNVNCGDTTNIATLVATDDAGFTRSSQQKVTVCKTPPGQALGTTAGAPKPARAALVVSKTGPRTATAGQLVTYRIKVANRSRIAARNVVLRDLLPSGFSVSGKVKGAGISQGRITWKVGTLAAGKSKTVSVKFRVDRNVGGRRCNRAVATAGNAGTARASQCTRIAAVAGAVEPAVTG